MPGYRPPSIIDISRDEFNVDSGIKVVPLLGNSHAYVNTVNGSSISVILSPVKNALGSNFSVESVVNNSSGSSFIT